jgi:hypothetical protein
LGTQPVLTHGPSRTPSTLTDGLVADGDGSIRITFEHDVVGHPVWVAHRAIDERTHICKCCVCACVCRYRPCAASTINANTANV